MIQSFLARGALKFLLRRLTLAPNMLFDGVTNRTEPRTAGQWIKYLVVAAIALFLVWWMMRVYVL